MVKKLFKHEFVYYLRSLLIYLPVLLVIGGLSRLMVCFESESGIYSLLLGSTLLMLYFGTLACVIITFILSIVRFYKNMFSAEGYLTLTLPVSKTTHLFVKLTTAVICIIITLLVVIGAWAIFLTGFPAELEEMVQLFGELFSIFKPVHLILYIIEIGVIMVLSTAYSYLIYYLCMSIGQMAKKYRIITAIATYFGYYIIMQFTVTLASMVVLALGLSDSLTDILYFIIDAPYASIHIALVSSLLVTALIDFLLFKLILVILNRKLNLE